jgi:tetratricopeptide (TPR) repeat protein
MYLLLALLLPLAASNNGSSVFPGDTEFLYRQYPSAVAAYESRLESGADSAEVLWRLARVNVCMGDITEGDESEALYRKGERLARMSVELDSLNPNAHTWLAVALGSIAVFEGSKSKVRMSNEIKYHLDRAVRLNPDDDVAYSVLGSFYAALGNVSWMERQLARMFLGRLPDGGYAEAEAAFKRAIVIAPNVVRHHYALGLLYRALDRPGEAREEFVKAASLPVRLARDVKDQQAAHQYLADLQ